MNIDRYMVNLFFEIKRNQPRPYRDSLKLSSATLGEELIKLFISTSDESAQRLIEVFLERAGDNWDKRLRAAAKRKTVKEMIQEHVSSAAKPKTKRIANSKSMARYYRGALIET